LAPDVVINAAAWTNVDGAESNPAGAYAANTLGPKYLAEGCAACGAALVQVSTNEVFPGSRVSFIASTTSRGQQHLCAQQAGRGKRRAQMLDRLYIVRLAWLFGPGGTTSRQDLAAAADRLGALRVVDDEFGNPTYAPDVAAAMVQLVESGRYGIYHLVNEGWCSRYELGVRRAGGQRRGHVPVTPSPTRSGCAPRHAAAARRAGQPGGGRLGIACALGRGRRRLLPLMRRSLEN
jgi:dTDP-4-dehydrorhamnose reductase